MIKNIETLQTSKADRRELHALVDHIPAGDLPAGRKILRARTAPVWQSILAATLDEEPESEQDRADVEKALSDPASEVPMEEVLHEYGLSTLCSLKAARADSAPHRSRTGPEYPRGLDALWPDWLKAPRTFRLSGRLPRSRR